jgi:hypothetical protein
LCYGTSARTVQGGILALRIDDREARLDGVQFILPDAPVEDFLPALLGIEAPPISALHERDREGPVILPYVDNAFVVPRRLQAVRIAV